MEVVEGQGKRSEGRGRLLNSRRDGVLDECYEDERWGSRLSYCMGGWERVTFYFDQNPGVCGFFNVVDWGVGGFAEPGMEREQSRGAERGEGEEGRVGRWKRLEVNKDRHANVNWVSNLWAPRSLP